ncbi:MAG TPA: peptidase [Bacteroidetes bacterium]|nr:peptidase [Bacteroidota bacterium]
MHCYPWFIVIICCLAACQSDLDKKISQLQDVELTNPEIPFNRDSALSFVAKQVDFGPRVPNLPSHSNCADYLINKLSSYGLSVKVQEAEVENFRGDSLSLRNIIAQYQPQHKTRIALICHWDTRPYADRETDFAQQKMLPDGANDGGSGTAIMLEIARLTQKTDVDLGIDFFFFDGEETGPPEYDTSYAQTMNSYCLGSQYYCENPLLNMHQEVGVLLDIVGGQKAKFTLEHHSVNQAYQPMLTFWALGHNLGFGQYFLEEKTRFVGNDDHVELHKCSDVPIFALMEYDDSRQSYNTHQHKMSDNIENVSKESLYRVGGTLWYYLTNYSSLPHVNE